MDYAPEERKDKKLAQLKSQIQGFQNFIQDRNQVLMNKYLI